MSGSASPSLIDAPEEPKEWLAVLIPAVGCGLVAISSSGIVMWTGLVLSTAGFFLAGPLRRDSGASHRLAVLTALLLIGVGVVLGPQGHAVGTALAVAGIGHLARWLPFDWNVHVPDPTVRLADLISRTAAILAALRLIEAGLVAKSDAVMSLLYLAAAVTLGVGAARLWLNWSEESVVRILGGMALCGLLARLARVDVTFALTRDVPSLVNPGIDVWIHGIMFLLMQQALHQAGHRGKWRRYVAAVVMADLAGFPSLPGFWLRSGLLLSMVSGQQASNITGEFEPHAALLSLAFVYCLAWGVLMAATLVRLISPNDESPA